MPLISGLIDGVEGIDRGLEHIEPPHIEPIEIGAEHAPTVPEVPEVPPIGEHPTDPTPEPAPAPEPTKPGVSSGGLLGAAGVGVGAIGFILPSILNSSAVTGAIAGAAQLGSTAIIGNDLSGMLTGLESNPVNLAIAATAAAGLLYLLFRR